MPLLFFLLAVTDTMFQCRPELDGDRDTQVLFLRVFCGLYVCCTEYLLGFLNTRETTAKKKKRKKRIER